MDRKSATSKVVRVLVVVAIIGIGIGAGTRAIFAHGRTNEQILSSYQGLVVIICIAAGIYGMVSSYQQVRPFRIIVSVLLLFGGVMWVIPIR